MLSQNIKVSANDSSNDGLESIMPQFVLCVRDFNLELEHNGEEMTADEYLEMCLQTKTAETQEDEKYNRPRECIKRYFTRRKVFTFDRPAGRKVMRTLDLAREEDLNEDFVHETEKFLAYIYTCPGKYLLNKSPVTGSMLAKLLREYVTTISDGNVPCVEDAMMIMARQENGKHANVAVEEYKVFLKQTQIPVYDKNELCDSHIKFKKEKLSSLQSKLMFDTDSKFQKSTEAEMQTLYEQFEKHNSKLLYEKCIDTLHKMHEETVKVNIKKGKYATSGGHDVYDQDMHKLYDEYNKELKNIDIAERIKAQHDFESKMIHENKLMMTEDKKLSEKESKDVMTTKLNTLKTELIQSQENERIKLETKLDDQRRFFEEKMEKAKMKEKEREKRKAAEHREELRRMKEELEEELEDEKEREREKRRRRAEKERIRQREYEQSKRCYLS
ncbi:guanylate-binding protein 2-like [Ruditapes philippinarum]|uniref:guanylate-binding protein 2-like n=1 Tax=Ruditapes philippinarum TaxID=129788 RepID=UPI00295AA55B|nr:guanylate-binding protein 2-like [Ruditapes philippinarum]